jgi:hypothetical protein
MTDEPREDRMTVHPKIVGAIERIDRTFEGWDCVRAPCERCKGRERDNHGIHSAERHLVVRTELDSGRRVALVLTIVTGVFPATVPEAIARSVNRMTDSQGREYDYYPRANDLSLHVQMPRGSGGHACCWFGEHGRCHVDYTTALGADEMFNPKIVDEALWQKLEQRLAQRLAENGIEGP